MRKRCNWPGENKLMIEYHDTEWGVPLHEDRKLFEFLLLDNGSVSLYRNTGSAKTPELASAVQLVPPVEKTSSQQPAKNVRCGTRSKLPAEFERHGWVWLFLRKENQPISAY